MRTAGIIRIIVGLVIAVLLTAILVVLLTGNNIFRRVGWDGGWIGRIVERATYSSGQMGSDSNEVIVSDKASVPADSIRNLKINWVAGSVNIRVGSGSDIVFYESSYMTLTDRQKMRYSVSDSGTLVIRYCDDLDNIYNWFSLDANVPSKQLTIEVPASLIGNLDGIEIDAVSAKVDLSGVYGDRMEITTVSGEILCADIVCSELQLASTSGSIICENCAIDTLKLNNVSGDIRAEGTFDTIKAESVSGSVRLACANVPDKINVDGVSGNVMLTLPEGAEFIARLDSVSGSISCDFPGTLGEDMVVVGNGSAEYRINTVSGSLKIEKN